MNDRKVIVRIKGVGKDIVVSCAPIEHKTPRNNSKVGETDRNCLWRGLRSLGDLRGREGIARARAINKQIEAIAYGR